MALQMETEHPYLQFERIEVGQQVLSECSMCKRAFQAVPKPNERTDDVLLRIRAEFDAHDCACGSSEGRKVATRAPKYLRESVSRILPARPTRPKRNE